MLLGGWAWGVVESRQEAVPKARLGQAKCNRDPTAWNAVVIVTSREERDEEEAAMSESDSVLILDYMRGVERDFLTTDCILDLR